MQATVWTLRECKLDLLHPLGPPCLCSVPRLARWQMQAEARSRSACPALLCLQYFFLYDFTCTDWGQIDT